MTLLVVLGPTGTGKSELAVDLALRLGGEIIGCDALHVYRGMDAATSKPTPGQRERVRHHLVDWLEPSVACTMADYVRAAEQTIEAIASRGHVPIVAGGTGLYLRGLLRGVFDAPPRDDDLRRRLRHVFDRRGAIRLHRWLERLDPASAARIPPGDTQRILRGLELALAGESTWSERLTRKGTWSSGVERYRSLKIGLDMDPALLGSRLDRRVDAFFAAGLVDEVRELLQRGVPSSGNAFKAIGYREVLSALERGGDDDRVREEIRRNTRRYAKRQRTWFRKEPDVIWLDASAESERLVTSVLRLWNDLGRVGAAPER